MVALEIFELELFKELVDLKAVDEGLGLLLYSRKVTFNSVQDGVLGRVVPETLVHDGLEVGAFLLVQAMHVRMEIRENYYTLHLLGHQQHFLKQLFKIVFELLLWRREGKVVFGSVVEADQSIDEVLLVGVVDLKQDHVRRLLVDLHLHLNHHIVDKADEGADVGLVPLGEKVDAVFQMFFFFEEHHRLVFGSLADLVVVEIVLVSHCGRGFNGLYETEHLISYDVFDQLVIRCFGTVTRPLLVLHEV